MSATTIRAKAVCIREPGGPEQLQFGTLEVAAPGPGQVRVEVVGAGLNRADVLQRRGFYPAPAGVPAHVPGLEFAGHVEAIGDGVTGTAVGSRVMGIVAGGAMATHLVISERELLPVPAGLNMEQAAAIPEAFLTAFDALFPRGTLQVGELLVIHAVTSGIGTAALQLGKAAGALVVGTSRSEDKLARCAELGLDAGVVSTGGRFQEALLEQIDGRRPNLIVDLVGGPYFQQNLNVLGTQGRLVVVGLLGGSGKPELPLFELMKKRLRIEGTVLRSRSAEEKATLTQQFIRQCIPFFDSRKLNPILDCTFPMEQIADAHRRMESNDTFGKTVMLW